MQRTVRAHLKASKNALLDKSAEACTQQQTGSPSLFMAGLQQVVTCLSLLLQNEYAALFVALIGEGSNPQVRRPGEAEAHTPCAE